MHVSTPKSPLCLPGLLHRGVCCHPFLLRCCHDFLSCRTHRHTQFCFLISSKDAAESPRSGQETSRTYPTVFLHLSGHGWSVPLFVSSCQRTSCHLEQEQQP